MRLKLFLISIIWISFTKVYCAAPPANDNITNPIVLTNVNGYCSTNAAYTNVDATDSGFGPGIFWNTAGKDVWFRFTAIGTDVNVTVTGQSTVGNNTLVNPLVAIYNYNNLVLGEEIGSMSAANNITTAYKGGLVIGRTYYIRISAENNATGTFTLCVNSYNPPRKPGQDCNTASVLCSKKTFTERDVTGAGTNNLEAAGTCVGVEANSAWYTWTAANNGTLAFTITPTSINDDIDWVLYDLGPSGTCASATPTNAIRCAAGSGVNCSPWYNKTGMNMTSVDITENGGCLPGQDGFVRNIDMVTGHVYALLVNNFSNGNNGFTIEFSGTGEFVGPSAEIVNQVTNACQNNQEFIFTANASGYNSLKWSFGDDASIATATTVGPHTITYSTMGIKTVVLEAFSNRGCSVIETYTFTVSLKPPPPAITANKAVFCIGDAIVLSVPDLPGLTYAWSGPDNFSANTPMVSIPANQFTQAGNYAVTVTEGNCTSDASIILIPPIESYPIAAFTTNPKILSKFSVPLTMNFINQSKGAAAYIWDFGDGQTSTDANPTHFYNTEGQYTITLKAFNRNGCLNTLSISNLILVDAGSLIIPNSFSPNGDGINDFFKIDVLDIKSYTINVYNRYGEKLFSTIDMFNYWDGNHQGKSMPVGAYFYVIEATTINDKKIKQSGSITLIK